ncbi:TspO/MBR family protein [Acetobacter fallax]|uniref:Tryptophan-rich sensory protein n=1 Tax=Acetobacter fallax TaxID=1737473 RepID=A0ABX0K9S7_9PROT|nr:TspO/MBR family protein [Acetobacter fallax]NHO31275.1 tryptophan-rich sensory protein [Acetobacter fallax]NHO34832.1 tryptophan-rich sensory protein [Acetobacter fallax]
MIRSLATALAGLGIGAAQIAGRRYNPTSAHPATREWYRSLNKPWYTPPGPVFGIVWSILDAALLQTGARIISAPPSRNRNHAILAWIATVTGTWLFPKVMFGWRRPDLAFGVTVGTLVAGTALTAATTATDRKAATGTLPLWGWLVFACVLQRDVWQRNRFHHVT